jgi:hypothetical protein
MLASPTFSGLDVVKSDRTLNTTFETPLSGALAYSGPNALLSRWTCSSPSSARRPTTIRVRRGGPVERGLSPPGLVSIRFAPPGAPPVGQGSRPIEGLGDGGPSGTRRGRAQRGRALQGEGGSS